MNALRHVGIYVKDIELMEQFYINVFEMYPICSREKDNSILFDELIGLQNAVIVTSKLITPYGKKTGQGDMVELVKVMNEGYYKNYEMCQGSITEIGRMHIAMGVSDINKTVSRIRESGGNTYTSIYEMKNGNYCCFCNDPEGNWIELIQRNSFRGLF